MIKCEDSVKETRQTVLFEDKGANPISSHQLKIRKGYFSQFSELLKKYHYKSNHIGGSISYNLILEYNKQVYGGIVIGTMRHKEKYEDKAVELRRMVLSPKCPKNTASYFLAKTIWWLKKNTDVSIVYTFADQTVGHTGICYKAANFKFVKETNPTIHILWNNKRYHPRSLTIDRPYSYNLRKAVNSGDAKIVKGKSKILYKYNIKRKI